MGGFLGFGNYDKPGKGVRKDAPEKNRFFLFFELYFRNIWKLIGINLLYMIACIPIVTFGPATTAMMKLTSDLVERKPIFIWHDFWSTFRKNFSSSLVWGILEVLLFGSIGYAFVFFIINLGKQNYFVYFGLLISAVLLVVLTFAFFHTWLLSAKVELKTFAMLKNGMILSAISFKANLILFVVLALLLFAAYILSPFSLILLPFFPMSTLGFLISYLYFPYVYMYIIKPYYQQSGEDDPYAPPEDEDEYEYVYEDEDGNVIELPTEKSREESIFSDAPDLEVKTQVSEKASGKTIK